MKTITIAVSTLALIGTAAEAAPGDRRAAFKERAQERFQTIDQNKDGTLSHDELMAQAQVRFDEFDQDGNGIILLEELPVKMPLPGRASRRLERMQENLDLKGASDEQRQRLEEKAEKRRPTRVKFMARLDRDENEQLDVEEFAAPMIKRYKRADINGDGSVTQSEFDEALERGMRKRRGERSRRR